MKLNPSAPETVHIDINSCFATIEQQANPFLRGKPVAVMANPNKLYGVALAVSVEAKKMGIKTGMRMFEARKLCPRLIQIPSDPEKYREVHRKMDKIIADYTDEYYPKSIDEFVLNLNSQHRVPKEVIQIVKEIKQRIKNEIGEWITVSAGIGTNRFWAKTAAGLIKPDGLVTMDRTNARQIYSKMDLVDLHGINIRNKIRLNTVGIYSPLEFLEAKYEILKAAFKTAGAHYWFTRLRGWEIDDVEFSRSTFGNTYTLPQAIENLEDLYPILSKLTTKAVARMREAGYVARGVHLGVRYQDYPYWHKGKTLKRYMFDTRDIYHEAEKLLQESPRKPVRNLAVNCFDLAKDDQLQLDMFDDLAKKRDLFHAIDKINDRWGSYTLTSARMIGTKKYVPDAISFGNL